MKAFLSIIYFIISLLPATRFYRFKTRIYQLLGFKFNSSVRLVSSVKLFGNIIIGRDTFVGHDVLITTGLDPVVIGDYVDIAPRVVIVNGTHEITPKEKRIAGRGYSKKIIINNGVWIGANTTIIGGVTIGEMTIIGAGSVVINNLPSYSICVGNPARPIKQWDKDKHKWITI